MLPPNTKILHSEDLVFGSILHLIKKYPSPRFRINPFVNVDFHTGKILLEDDLDKLENLLSNKFEDEELVNKEIIVNEDELKDALN